MSKLKSAIALTLITILIAGVCFMCTATFSYGYDGMTTFNSFISMLEKDSNLGGMLGDGENYLGGGYSSIYYPEGVISAQEYADNHAQLEEMSNSSKDTPEHDERVEALENYEKKYARYPDENGAVYVDKEIVFGDKDGTAVSDEFKADFARAEKILRNRLEGLHMEGVAVDVRDDYTFRITLSAYSGAQAVMLNYFSYMGEVDMGYGSSASAATHLVIGEDETIRDYIAGATTGVAQGTAYVVLNFTRAGASVISGWTSAATTDSPVTLYFYVGDESIVQLQVTSAVSGGQLAISGNYNAETARAIALTIDSTLKGEPTEMTFTIGETMRLGANFGDAALPLIYIAVAVLFVGMLVFFFIRYRGLGIAHLYTSLSWLLVMILLVWGIPFLHLGYETVMAVVLAGTLFSVSEAVAYESVKKEYAVGKTMISSFKAGYKKIFWKLFDLHIALALIAFFTYFVALGELSVFAFTLGLGVVLSALCLAFGCFVWYALMSFPKNQGKFCNFVREEVEDDE